MKTRDIRKRAMEKGINTNSDNKVELVRAIQAAEGNPQCFQTGRATCDQTECCWMEDCVPQQYAQMPQASTMGARIGKWRR
jgi:hypothetical protein